MHLLGAKKCDNKTLDFSENWWMIKKTNVTSTAKSKEEKPYGTFK